MAQIKIVIPPQAAGENLLKWLVGRGYALPADCGGRGSCGKCRVTVVKGKFYSQISPEEELIPDQQGQILSCRALCPAEETIIYLEDSEGDGLTGFSDRASFSFGVEKGFAVALDIGTTTLAAALVDRSCGRVVSTQSCLNPQRSFGADVISRIDACGRGQLKDLSSCVREKTQEMLDIFFKNFPQARPETLWVSGNTTMLHLFAGISPQGMGMYPFTPAFTAALKGTGAEFGLSVPRVQLLPSASAFIGSDVVGGILVSGMLELDAPSVIMDIGTNGEMALFTGKRHGAKLFAASTAAGPALEGAQISCGIGGIPGAVHRVFRDGCNLKYATIGDQPPRGICGCGLLDWVAVLLKDGEMDESGYLEAGECALEGMHVGTESQAPLEITPTHPRLALTQQDVRELQLAKSAMRAGLEALVAYAELELTDIEKVFVAGGLGVHLDPVSAVQVGLLPPEVKERIVPIGNSSLAGAVRCALSHSALSRMEEIANVCKVVELNTSSVFNEAFVEHMCFPEESDE